MLAALDEREGPRSLPWAMMAANAGLLVAAFALQRVAIAEFGSHQALSDLPRVFLHRGIGPGEFPYVDRPIEYPILAGLLLYVAAVLAPSPIGVLAVTAAAASVVSITITVLLERRCGSRAWRWAVGLPVLLYAFQNWDVFAIGAMVAALIAFEHRSDRLAGAALGVGAAVKLFPAVLAPPLVALRWVQGDRGGARRLAISTAITFAALNVPFVIANPQGWWWPFAFQGRRAPTWGTAWFYLFRLGRLPVDGVPAARLGDAVSIVVLGAGIGWLTVVAARRRLSPAAIGAAAVAIFLLSNKVYSPTYDVWLVVFFVLLPLSRRLWLAFCAIDLGVYATVYGHFVGPNSHAFVLAVLPVLVAARTVILVRLVVAAVGSPGAATLAVATRPVPPLNPAG